MATSSSSSSTSSPLQGGEIAAKEVQAGPILPLMSALPPHPSAYVPMAAPARQSVVITDIDMPFGAMVRFIVKLAIAAIPALIILWILFAIVFGVLAMLFGGIFFHGPLFPPHGTHF